MAGETVASGSAEHLDVAADDSSDPGLLYGIFHEIISSPLNLALVGVITFLLYKIMKSRQQPTALPEPEPELPRLRRDFTVAELKKYDGTQPDGRLLVAVNGTVYDVTKGKRFYGPGARYSAFGGRDASRGLATFQVTGSNEDEYDDLSDLNASEMEAVREWDVQFREKYIVVGRLLKPGEQPTNYSDEDEDATADGSEKKKRAAAAAAAAKTLGADTPAADTSAAATSVTDTTSSDPVVVAKAAPTVSTSDTANKISVDDTTSSPVDTATASTDADKPKSE
ncbi:membrane-associated progesterone receptor component 1-like [Anopheles cruzii]|uniref:membrane-associated progesterone receptor component 1-like n=1 Tax=Anopheles cruzii TaxID=68878 RepID=UPI0022EC1AC5|nr:membrane-associated progesterone receptor component 1-like [Anopheles cruzii]XP_052866758.1 membrane-associated progesterone receptor component 1-like [Anopheles cruzii]XP_052866766.1 membrane-associated progesterone receptor component 1-like [Anopheles cruzii]XP_052866773.1 membrane-associated progesterone receptor component 1-like [Anopheles cruzii]